MEWFWDNAFHYVLIFAVIPIVFLSCFSFFSFQLKLLLFFLFPVVGGAPLCQGSDLVPVQGSRSLNKESEDATSSQLSTRPLHCKPNIQTTGCSHCPQGVPKKSCELYFCVKSISAVWTSWSLNNRTFIKYWLVNCRQCCFPVFTFDTFGQKVAFRTTESKNWALFL